MEFIIIDGKRMTTVEETHRYLERTLRLPPYYGHNLDALYDCLGDLSQNVIIILINGDLLDANLGDYAAKLRKVFLDANKVPFSFRFIENPS
jgi:ribonuclease inhibitor